MTAHQNKSNCSSDECSPYEQFKTLLHSYSASRQLLSEAALTAVTDLVYKARGQQDSTLAPIRIERTLHGELSIFAPLCRYTKDEDPISQDFRDGRFQLVAEAVSLLVGAEDGSVAGTRCALAVTGGIEGILSLQLHAPAQNSRHPALHHHLRREQWTAIPHHEALFYCFLSLASGIEVPLAERDERRALLDWLLEQCHDSKLLTLAALFRTYPIATPSDQGLLKFRELEAKGRIADHIDVPELDEALRKIKHLVRAIPPHAELDRRSSWLAEANYQPSPFIKNLLEIERNCGAHETLFTRAATELFSFAAEVAMRAAPNLKVGDPIDAIGDVLHNFFRFDLGRELSISTGLSLHRFNSKIAAILFYEAAYQLRLNLELAVVCTREERRYLLTFPADALRPVEFIDPLAVDTSTRRLASAAPIIEALRRDSAAPEEFAGPIRLPNKAFLAQHVLDITRPLFERTIALRNLGAFNRSKEQNAEYADLIVKNQKIARTALNLFANTAEAHLRVGDSDNAMKAAVSLGGEALAKLYSNDRSAQQNIL